MIEIIYVCPNCDKLFDSLSVCLDDGSPTVAHDSRCNDDCPRCRGMGACSDLYMGDCMPCGGQCVPHSERCGMVCDFECPRYQVRVAAPALFPENKPHRDPSPVFS